MNPKQPGHFLFQPLWPNFYPLGQKKHLGVFFSHFFHTSMTSWHASGVASFYWLKSFEFPPTALSLVIALFNIWIIWLGLCARFIALIESLNSSYFRNFLRLERDCHLGRFAVPLSTAVVVVLKWHKRRTMEGTLMESEALIIVNLWWLVFEPPS